MLRHYLRVSDLLPTDLGVLLDLAHQFKWEPHGMGRLLADEVVGLYFDKPSTRTRVSFTVAISHLGGNAEMLGPGDLQLGRGETIEDTARVLSLYLRAFVIRTFRQGDVERFARAADIPVVNALTNEHHPCQALADLLTLREHFGTLHRLRIAYVGDGNNVAHSLMEAGALAGADVVIAAPLGYCPDPRIVEAATAAAEANNGRVSVVEDPYEAVAGANAVYSDVWLSMGDSEEEREARVAALRPYRVTESLVAHAREDAVFLHCLPAHRGDEVVPEVIDGPRSLVFEQAGNRLCTEQAVLAALLLHRLDGSNPAAELERSTS
jgi:ornithine carbamoyltransferase